MNVLLHIIPYNTLQRKSKQITIKSQVTFFPLKETKSYKKTQNKQQLNKINFKKGEIK